MGAFSTIEAEQERDLLLAKIGRLEFLVRSAFIEGVEMGLKEARNPTETNLWDRSKSSAALAGAK